MKNIKQISLLSIFTIILLFSNTSCKDSDKYIDWKILNEKWLETHKSEPGFIQTESGLCYKVIHQGAMRRPNSASWIVANYTGKLIDGTQFDSGTYSSYLSGAIKGWQEGILKMNGGGKYIFYIPADLGYGVDGSGTSIAPYSTLIFEVELLDSYQ
ncbi:MAG: FKBP-type peptidyl-prolyl cis-trans isomerase [Paludibacter sp.]|nr:FKBP-type peptidyl-prolyl cis-trans isomerase [Paludibacter sp.]